MNTVQELNHLNDKINYWWKERGNRSKAMHYIDRFSELLSHCGKDDGSIMLQDHWALLHEIRNEIVEAISHREKEIALVKRLFSIGGPVGIIDYKWLSDKLSELAILYEKNGENDRASSTLIEVEGLLGSGRGEENGMR
jgi:hypothetical protein